MMRKFLAAAIGLLLLGACGDRGKSPEASAPGAPVVRGVEVGIATPALIPEEYEAVGTVQSRRSVTLSSKLMGTVTSLSVKVGDRVPAGKEIAVIDARDAEARLAKAEAGVREADAGLTEIDRADAAAAEAVIAAQVNRDLARSTYDRFKVLFERGSLSRQEYEEAEARYKEAEAQTARAVETRKALQAKRDQVLARGDQARADIDDIRSLLSYSVIPAPMAGIVVSKPAEVGILAVPGAPLVTIEEEGRYRLEAVVEETLLPRIRSGETVRVRIDALGGEEAKGRIDEIAPTSDPLSRTRVVKIALEVQKGLRSGLFGRAYFPGTEREALLLPGTALLERGQMTGVLVVGGDGVIRFRLVRTGRERGDRVEILSGLEAGERFLVEGSGSVVDGSRLE